jgi:hypothetical protein
MYLDHVYFFFFFRLLNFYPQSITFFNWQDETLLSRPNCKLGPITHTHTHTHTHIFFFSKNKFQKLVLYPSTNPPPFPIGPTFNRCTKIVTMLILLSTTTIHTSYSSFTCINYKPWGPSVIPRGWIPTFLEDNFKKSRLFCYIAARKFWFRIPSSH